MSKSNLKKIEDPTEYSNLILAEFLNHHQMDVARVCSRIFWRFINNRRFQEFPILWNLAKNKELLKYQNLANIKEFAKYQNL